MKSCLFYFLSLIFSFNLLLSTQPALADEETSETIVAIAPFYAPAPVMGPKDETTYVLYQGYQQTTAQLAPPPVQYTAMPMRATLAPFRSEEDSEAGVVSGEHVPIEAEEHGEGLPAPVFHGEFRGTARPVVVAAGDGINTAIPGYRPIPGEVLRPNINEPAPMDEVAANDLGSDFNGNGVFEPARNGTHFNGGGCSLASATGGVSAWDLLCLGGLFLPLLRSKKK